MSRIINAIFKKSPLAMQNIAISLVTTNLYRVRHGGVYKPYRKYYATWESASEAEIDTESKKRLNEFLNHAKNNSLWYKQRIGLSSNFREDLRSLPLLEKIDIINNLNSIKTIDAKEGIINNTGGTTGNSMQTVYMKSDMQERFAVLDHFREQHGYKIGKKTAWFSGKNLISEKDINKKICSHYDFINKIRFYSTFHINQKNFDIYWESLQKFKPEFIVGFPSSVYELCRIAETRNLKLDHKVKVFFPTAETVTSQHREVIGRILGCKLVNQYASSEGAPFILECRSGNLHIHSLTGVFEVVDENMQPTNEGELLVTSFTTKGTPLIRYRIGDRIKLSSSSKSCDCGSNFPLVDRIDGRTNDFLYSPDKGKIYTVSLIDSTKGIDGLLYFQAIQNNTDEININLVVNDKFNQAQEKSFVSNVRLRVGNIIKINITYVNEIKPEKSGKFRIVKNSLNLDDM